jgi:hypothetical protein
VIDRPNLVPVPTTLVVKRGSEMCCSSPVDHQRKPVLLPGGRESNHFARRVRQGIAGIGQRVHEDVLQLDGIADDDGVFCSQVQPYLNLPEAQ